ncbi:MAG: hypothetical protein ABSH28_15945 [Acidobacteriota bacterium]
MSLPPGPSPIREVFGAVDTPPPNRITPYRRFCSGAQAEIGGTNIKGGLGALFNSKAALGTWVNTSFGAISIGILIKQRTKIPVSYLVFALMFALISTSNEYIYGMTRYTIPLIPLYIAVVESSEILYQAYVVLNIAFLAINISAFVTGTGTFI